MKKVVLVEKDKYIQNLIIDKFNELGFHPTILYCDTMAQASQIESAEELHFFINKTLQTYANLPSPYCIIYDVADLDQIDEYVLYVKTCFQSLDDVFSEVSFVSNLFDRLILSDTNDKVMIHFDDIIAIERVKRYSLVKTKNRIYSTRLSFEELFKQLNEDFVQTHRSYIVNFTHVNMQSRSAFLMDTQEVVPISRSQSKMVMDRWNTFKKLYKK